VPARLFAYKRQWILRLKRLDVPAFYRFAAVVNEPRNNMAEEALSFTESRFHAKIT
jgi:hypothetical protein